MLNFRILFLIFCFSPYMGFSQPVPDPALDILQTANALYNRGLHGPAREQFQLFLDRYPQHDQLKQARMGRALCWVAEADLEKAEPEILKLANDKGFSKHEEMRQVLAGVYLKQQQWQKALDAAGVLAGQSTREDLREQARRIQVEAAFGLQDWKRLAGVATPPLDDRMRYLLGSAQMKLGESQNALQTLQPLTEKENAYAHPATWLSARLMETGNPAEAVKLYERAAYTYKGGQSAVSAWLGARLAWSSGDRKLAESSLTSYLKSYPDESQAGTARILLGRVKAERGDKKNAAKEFEQAMKQEDVRHQAAVRLVEITDRDNEKAIILKEALAWPADATWTPYLLMAEAERDLASKRVEEALGNLRTLVGSFSGHDLVRDARVKVIQLLAEAGKNQETIDEISLFLKAYPQDIEQARFRLLRAGYQRALGRQDEAISELKAILSEKPEQNIAVPARKLLAQLYVQKEQWKQVVEVLGPLREEKEPEALRLSGIAALQLKDWDATVSNLTAWLALPDQQRGKEEGDVRVALATALEASNQVAEALPVLLTFVNQQANDERIPELRFKLAQWYVQLDQAADAEKQWQMVADQFRSSPMAGDALAELARLRRDQEKPGEAADLLLRLAKEHENHRLAGEAALQAGQLYTTVENSEKAREALSLFIRQSPQDPQVDEATYLLARSWRDAGKQSEAEKTYTQLIQDFPESERRPQGLYELAWLKRDQDKAAESVELYQELLTQYDQHALTGAARTELAGVFRALGQDADALEILKDADLSDPRVRLEQAWAWFRSGQFDEAEKGFVAVASSVKEPEMIRDAWFQAGESALRRKDFGTGLKYYLNAQQVGTELQTPALLLRTAEAQGMSGLWGDSLETARELQRRFSKDDLIHRAVYQEGWALENQGKYREAIARYREGVEHGGKTPTAARCQFQIGECLLALGQNDAAIAAFMQVIETHAVEAVRAPAMLEMADTLRKTGKETEALQSYRTLIKTYPEHPAAAVAEKNLQTNP